MKGIILAGGTGSRLRPVTYNTAKQLIPLGDQSVIEHVITNLKSNGITEIGVVIGNNSTEKIKRHLGDGSKFGVEITYILQGEPLGLAHAVGCTADFVRDESFVVYFGDTIIDPDITLELLNKFDPSIHDVGIPLQHVEDPSRFGIAQFNEDGKIERVLEKPDDPPSTLAYVGVVAFTSSFFDVVAGLEPSDRGELELTEAIDEYVKGNGTAMTIEVDGTWKDVGTPEDVVEANKILLEEIEPRIQGEIHQSAKVGAPVVLGEGSYVGPDATVHGPSVIGNNTTITSGTEIGPYVTVGDDCTLGAKKVESSVLFDGVTIDISRELVESIIGSNTTLSDSENQKITCELGWDNTIKL